MSRDNKENGLQGNLSTTPNKEGEPEGPLTDDAIITWLPYGEMTVKQYKTRIWKNVLVLSFAFMLNYIAYGGLANLQSSLHKDEGMGTICTSVRYFALVFSCIFIPKLMIRGCTHKWTIAISLFGFLIWCAANGIGTWGSMVPASIINGFFVAPMWAAQGSYFTGLSREYARVSNENFESRIGLFMGIYYAFYVGAGIFGNTISSTVLQSAPGDNYNRTTSEEAAMYCGINDAPGSDFQTSEDELSDTLVWTLVGIYLVIDACSILVVAFLVDHYPKHLIEDSGMTVRQELKGLVGSTFKQMQNPLQLLLIPITFYMGIEEAFYGAEFNNSWTNCVLGIWYIGITNIPFAVMGTFAALGSGRLVKYTGRLPIFVIALVIDLVIQLTLFFWVPNPDQEFMFFLIPTFWGTSDAIWVSLVGAMYGMFFPDQSEAAFSNYMMWWCLGLAAGFGYSAFLNTFVKLIILFFFLWLGVGFYFLAEIYHAHLLKTTNALEHHQKVVENLRNYEMMDVVVSGRYSGIQEVENDLPRSQTKGFTGDVNNAYEDLTSNGKYPESSHESLTTVKEKASDSIYLSI